MFEIVLDDNDDYSHRNYDIRRTKRRFHLPQKKDATFKKQRPSKIPIHLRKHFEIFSINARYLNSITDTSNSIGPLELLNVLMTSITGTIFTSSDLSSAYNQVPLTEDTQKVTSFIVGGRKNTYQLGFYGL